MVAAVSTTPNLKVRPRAAVHRPPLLPSETENGRPNRRPKAREVTSRYLSSTSSASTTKSSSSGSSSSSSNSVAASRRSPSPLVPRAAPTTPFPAVAKRSQSAERRRPATPRPVTPHNVSEVSTAAKQLMTSSRRSLSVSFQGESFSLPISRAKPAPAASSASNARKCTPERRKAVATTPVRDQRENSRPIDSQRWPGRSGGANSLTRSVDCTNEKARLGGSVSVVRALQKSMVDERIRKPERENDELDRLVKAVVDPVGSDTDSVSSDCNGSVVRKRGVVVPARFWQESGNRSREMPLPGSGSPVSKSNGVKPGVFPANMIGAKKLLDDNSPTSSPRGVLASRGLSSPIRGAVRPASPSKGVRPVSPSKPVRPASPSKAMSTLMSSAPRGMASPSRMRNGVASTLSFSLDSTPSILSFVADARRARVGENRIVDAHVLRLLHNRQLQWRFVNARADAAMLVQTVTTEKSLYNAWVTTSKLRHSVKSKRIELQLLRQNLRLYSALKGQMLHLDDWDLIDRDHYSSLSGATGALEASTLRLPIVGGARADIQNVKDSISSAVGVMQAMASSICSLLTKVEHVNSLVSELASITTSECASLDQCKDLLSTLTDIQ
ncbi:hypothetical protein RJ639_038249, partial [Escallonia herrerae]